MDCLMSGLQKTNHLKLNIHSLKGKLEDMLICLALCHTVRVDHPQEDVDGLCRHSYQSASPDEKALVEACARLVLVIVHNHRHYHIYSVVHSFISP